MRGTDLIVGVYDETTYGQDPGAPSGTRLRFSSVGAGVTQNLVEDNTIDSRHQGKPARGNIDVAFPVTMPISAENIGFMMRHALGQVATTGIGPYVHTVTLGNLPVGFVLEKNLGSGITGNNFEKFNGCKVASATFKFPQEGRPEATFNLKGAKQTMAAAALDATLTDNGHTPFDMFEATLKEGGATVAIITDLELTIDNGLDEDGYAIGNAGVRSLLDEGQIKLTGKFSAMFSDSALIDKAAAFTESSIQAILSRGTGAGSAGNEYFDLLLEQCVYKRTSVPVEGPAGVRVSYEVSGYKSGANLGLKSVIKNALATI